MASEEIIARLESVLTTVQPLICLAPPTRLERPDHRAWEWPEAYAGGRLPFELIAALDNIILDLLGKGSSFGGPLGGSGIRPRNLRSAMAERIALGIEPSVVACDMAELITRRRCDVLCIFLLAGIKVDTAVSLKPGVELRPINELPPSQLRDALIRFSDDGQFGAGLTITPSAALVFLSPDFPVLFDWVISQDPTSVFQMNTAKDMHDTLQRVLAACALSGCPGVLYIGNYQHYVHSALGYEASTRTHTVANILKHIIALPLDVERICRTLPKIERLEGAFWDAIDLSISRVSRASRAENVADMALDLGIAIELLLLHKEKSPGAKGELRYKIGTRGAWLVAESPDERRIIFDAYSKLYDYRSAAAHQGRIAHDRYAALEATRPYVVRLITRLVDIGHIPDWTDLVLGLLEKKTEERMYL